MKRIVWVDMAGGLGNQIFLFKAANFIASINKNILLVNMASIDKSHSDGKSSIGDFVFPKTVKFFQITARLNFIYVRTRNFLRRFNDYNQSLIFVLDEKYSSYTREELYKLVLGKNPLLMIVTGFWQSFEYWDRNFRFELKVEGGKFLELSNKIMAEQPIVFHYRLGRTNHGWEHGWGALSPAFLSNSLLTLDETNAKLKTVWIFSNDLSEAKKITEPFISRSHQFFYIDDSALSPAELLLLLSLSQTLICSNSTFSILAAKIGNVPNVLVPSKLSKNGHKGFELPDQWIKINSTWLD